MDLCVALHRFIHCVRGLPACGLFVWGGGYVAAERAVKRDAGRGVRFRSFVRPPGPAALPAPATLTRPLDPRPSSLVLMRLPSSGPGDEMTTTAREGYRYGWDQAAGRDFQSGWSSGETRTIRART